MTAKAIVVKKYVVRLSEDERGRLLERACQLVGKRTATHLWSVVRSTTLQHKQPHATWPWLRV